MVFAYETVGSAQDSGSTFTFNQQSPSDVWHVNHNMRRFPSVTVVDTARTEGICDVKYVDEDNVTLTFAAPMSGYAYLN